MKLDVANFVVGFLVLGVASVTLGYVIRQDSREKSRQKQEADDAQWAERFEHLVRQLTRINPKYTARDLMLYPSIFPDTKFQEALETYIIEVTGSTTQFSARNPSPDQLRRKAVRETIQRAEQCIAEFQKNHPAIDLKYYMP